MKKAMHAPGTANVASLGSGGGTFPWQSPNSQATTGASGVEQSRPWHMSHHEASRGEGATRGVGGAERDVHVKEGDQRTE